MITQIVGFEDFEFELVRVCDHLEFLNVPVIKVGSRAPIDLIDKFMRDPLKCNCAVIGNDIWVEGFKVASLILDAPSSYLNEVVFNLVDLKVRA